MLNVHSDRAFYLLFVFIPCVLWHVFRELADVYPDVANTAVPPEVVVLCSSHGISERN